MSKKNPPSELCGDAIRAIESVVGSGFVALHEPLISDLEYIKIKECLDSNYVSSVGRFVDEFEIQLAKYTGSKYAVAVVNGTAALHLALHVGGVKPQSEVLVPALTFVATAAAVTYCGAIPHFIDCDEVTMGIDGQRLMDYLNKIAIFKNNQLINKSTGRIISALVPMHTFGHPSNLDELLKVATEFRIPLIEDSAESLGSYYKGHHTGTYGLMGVLSFNGNKIITTGGGGAILTNDENIARRLKHLSTTAKVPHAWEFNHDEVGFNYRMPNINAALGCAQLERIHDIILLKRAVHESYKNAFSDVDGLDLVTEPPGSVSNYWLNAIKLHRGNEGYKNKILEASNLANIQTRPVWSLISELKPYSQFPKMDLLVAQSLADRIINLPSSPKIAIRNGKD